jgi:hypothetical protein
MVRPAVFYENPETAPSNAFQGPTPPALTGSLLATVQGEFDQAAGRLARAGVATLVHPARAADDTPDALFPNNWISTHADGTLVLYPMLAANRRRERRLDLVDALEREHGYRVRRRLDLSALENRGAFVEGTGSLILDRPHRRAFVCRSPRSTAAGIAAAAEALGIEALVFDALDARGEPIYHTNVMLSIGTGFALWCPPALPEAGRERIAEALSFGRRALVALEHAQLAELCANVLELRGDRGEPLLALSERALAALRPAQRRALEQHASLVPVAIPAIETVGGGGIRCMLAEVFLPRAGGAV